MNPSLCSRVRLAAWHGAWLAAWVSSFLLAWADVEPAFGLGVPLVLTNAAAVRSLTPEESARHLPVRLRGVITYYFDPRACFIQDPSAGIFVGNGSTGPRLAPGDLVALEGTTGAGEYAPIVQPAKLEIIGHTNLPAPTRVSYEDLVMGSEDSQWVEIAGLVRAVFAETRDPTNGVDLEIAVGGDRFTAFVPGITESNLTSLVDCEVKVRGVCSTRFNRQRQLFSIRFLVPFGENIAAEKPAAEDVVAQPARPIGSLLRFTVQPSAYGRRAKVAGTVIMYQPGSSLFVQDKENGLYVRTRQSDPLEPGDRVELVGFPMKGDYTPILEDAIWHKTGSGPEPEPTLIRPDDALGGLHDCQLVTIEGRLLDHAFNNNELVLLLESDDWVFSAHLVCNDPRSPLVKLENGSRLRLTGVCRIEVGDIWRAGSAWHAKSFRVLLRRPADMQVLKRPPWWTLPRLLWALGVLMIVVIASLVWVGMLRQKVGQQTELIRSQRDVESGLKERYQDLFENANDLVYTHDLRGQITSINLAGERLLGSPRAEIIRKNFLDFIVEEQRPSAVLWLKQIVDGAAVSPVEWDFVPTSGGRVQVEISTRLIERGGRQVEVEGIARDVTEHRRLEKEILETSTREQQRIGHDLHDGVCQQLAGIGFLSDILFDQLEEQNRPEAAAARKITELVNQANKQARGMARGLFPVRLEENGLASALEELANSAGAFFSTKCEFQCEPRVVIRDHSVAQHLYYIAQEAIINAAKHGKPRLIQIHLKADGGDGCLLLVRDDGSGLPAMAAGTFGMGLRIMKYRARLIHATLQVHNRLEGGVEILCRLIG